MPGIKPKKKVNIRWSPDFAYAVGLLVTDGCLSSDGRHISFVSKDRIQLLNFMRALKIKVRIGYKTSGSSDRKYPHIQLGDVNFYRFLLSIGLTPAKSKTIEEVDVPRKYFFDFLRGSLDGDGYFYSYWDPRWPRSYMFYLGFTSASRKHIEWIRRQIFSHLGVKGHLNRAGAKATYQLKFAKSDSLKLLKKIYHSRDTICLPRKRLKIERALSIIGR